MSKTVLITGGAGFIGSHLADELLRYGYRVRAIDTLTPQVHGTEATRPAYLAEDVELITGDLCDRKLLRRALEGVDIVYHFAAKVGVGQSMYQVADYTAVNNLGTAVLIEEIVARKIERLVVASSMSIYGEGFYRNTAGKVVAGHERNAEQLRARQWELLDAQGQPLIPVPTTEEKPPSLASVYALSKFDQERMCLMLGRAYKIPTVALRFFNVYGPRQSLSNPYTGVLAIFAVRLLNGRPPLIFEDGQQQRDFVNVADIARACRLAIETPQAAGEVFNIGSGQPITICEVAARLADVLGSVGVEAHITGNYRAGDIRHCFADIARAREVLGYEPRVTFAAGLEELAGWLEGQIAVDRVPEARVELLERGLSV
jgi:dTDP-L-rhamnose 4-epimerase